MIVYVGIGGKVRDCIFHPDRYYELDEPFAAELIGAGMAAPEGCESLLLERLRPEVTDEQRSAERIARRIEWSREPEPAPKAETNQQRRERLARVEDKRTAQHELERLELARQRAARRIEEED